MLEICFLSYQYKVLDYFQCFNIFFLFFFFLIIEGYIIPLYSFQQMFIMYKVKNFSGKKSHKSDENRAQT